VRGKEESMKKKRKRTVEIVEGESANLSLEELMRLRDERAEEMRRQGYAVIVVPLAERPSSAEAPNVADRG
jgi:hypothetical protein